MKKIAFILVICTIGILIGCSSQSYQSISMSQAQEIFEEGGDYIIVDVRTREEYDTGHILYAINIPNESIGSTMLEELPNKNETIYVYCRSGNRSKQAASKLVSIGYTNVIECGGIQDYTGDLVVDIVDEDMAMQNDELLSNLEGQWKSEDESYSLDIQIDTNKVVMYRGTVKILDSSFNIENEAENYIFTGVGGLMLDADCNHYNVLDQMIYNKSTSTIYVNMTFQDGKRNIELEKI